MRTTDKTACKSCHLNDWYIFVIGSIVQSQNWFKVQTKTHSNTNNLILHSNCIQFYLFKDLLDPSDQNCVLTIRSVELWPKNLLETGRWLSTRKIWFENILRWFDGHTATLWAHCHTMGRRTPVTKSPSVAGGCATGCILQKNAPCRNLNSPCKEIFGMWLHKGLQERYLRICRLHNGILWFLGDGCSSGSLWISK